jgi:single-stranded DNA-binding protein
MIIANVIGNLGRAAEQKSLDNGSVTNFSIASTDYNSKTKSKYLVKGQKVAVSGKLSVESYTKKDGEIGFSTKLNVDQIELCGGKSDNANDEDIPW